MAMTTLLVCDKEDVVVASFSESRLVDQALIQQIEKDFQALVAQAASGRKLLVDFSRVEFISSMMIGLIVRLQGQCKRAAVRLKLCAVSPTILEAFRITGLRKVLEIYADESKAIEAFALAGSE
jgi:anti-sigma B factor antagonist